MDQSRPEPTEIDYARLAAYIDGEGTCERAHDLLVKSRPYFITKGDQADIIIAFRETVSRVGVKGHPPEVLAQRKQMREDLKELRHKEYPKEYFDITAKESKSPRKTVN
jgi:hypothetical protein